MNEWSGTRKVGEEGRNAKASEGASGKGVESAIVKGPFSQEEDRLILKYVADNGPHSWSQITKLIPERTAKQCRERWFNHLDSSVSKEPWNPAEDEAVFKLYEEIGPKWSLMAKSLPGRTDNSIKNRWNSSLSKRIIRGPSGESILIPDKSKRMKRKALARERPPPIVTQALVAQQIPQMPQNAQVPFISFSLPTPISLGSPSPTSPIPGFQVTPGAFGGLISPPFQISPTFKTNFDSL